MTSSSLPVIEMLHSLGVPASKRNKSDIVIMDDKISGNAQIIKGKKIIHHGTLLFDADLEKLRKYLKFRQLVIQFEGD